MDPVAALVEKLNGFTKSAHDLAYGLLNSRHDWNSRNPIEILKRLQRESFSDIMKIRDRQDKVERLLTFYKSSKGNPFQDAGTHVRGKVNVRGALFFLDDLDEQKFDTIQRSGIQTGIDALLTFETSIRDTDTLTAEFKAGHKGQVDVFSSPLSLGKIMYTAHVSNWLSAVAIPMGASCRDVSIATTSHQGRGITEFRPPLLNQHIGSGIGIMVRKLNVVASLAQFFSDLGLQHDFPEITRTSTTFGQVALQLSRNTKLSLLGIRRGFRPSTEIFNLGPLSFPTSIFKRKTFSDVAVGGRQLDGSIALMLDSELDESTRLGGWIEMRNSDPGSTQWAVTMRDTPEAEFGWGLTVGGSLHGPKSLEHFQVETFLNFNFGSRFKLQPGLVFVKDGATQFPAALLRSSWSL